jgi:single-strand DNA-binding protein
MIMGRVGQDPQIRTGGNTKFASFSVATSERYTTGTGERKEKTTWHRIKGVGKICESIEQSIKKGCEVFIVGKIENGQYEKDGHKVNTSEVAIGFPGSVLRVLSDGRKGSGDGEPLPGDPAPPKRTDHTEKKDELNDEIPW